MAGCDFGWVAPTVGGYCVGDGSGTAPKDLGGSGFDDIADDAARAAATVVKALGGAWMDLGTPDLGAQSGPVALLRGSTLWFTSFTAVLCLLIAAGHLAWQRRSEPARQALQGLLNLVVVSAAGVATVNLLATAGDRFSVWIIDRSTGCRHISATGEPVAECVAEFDKRTSAMLALGGTDSSFLVLIMALLVIVAGIAQIALMIMRMAMLVILSGTLPLSAAASSTPTGRVWFRRSVGWLLAFVLYKPAAAVVYAAAFSTTGRRQDDQVVSMVSGVVLIVLACFTLPALLRFAAPVVQAAASGTGRGARGAAAATAGAGSAAVGALAVPHLRGLAAGRSVSGAAVGADPAGTRFAPGAGPGRTARGAGTATAARDTPPARGRTAAEPVPPAPEAADERARTHPQDGSADPVTVPARPTTDQQQEESRGRR
ncbi:hypothetical protein [Streptomyces sp. NPDC101249]|uniref:hypothetical protein n=1 Tax=Streptomyces sp. NPDC101249 TaxID=3366140 RepID=UPI00381164CD